MIFLDFIQVLSPLTSNKKSIPNWYLLQLFNRLIHCIYKLYKYLYRLHNEESKSGKKMFS